MNSIVTLRPAGSFPPVFAVKVTVLPLCAAFAPLTDVSPAPSGRVTTTVHPRAGWPPVLVTVSSPVNPVPVALTVR
jgi:hypothetical protein